MSSKERPLLGIIREALSMDKTRLLVFGKTTLLALREVSKPEPDFTRIRDLVSSDPALSAQVLRVANSPMFRTLREADNIDEAIRRLGINWVTSLLVLMSRKEQFKAKDPVIRELMDQLWKHAVGCGIAANWLAKKTGRPQVMHEAFLAGVLHDEGKLFLLTVLQSLLESDRIGRTPSKTMILQVLDLLHAEYGFTLLKSWNIPPLYCEVARDHHRRTYDADNDVLVLVRLADKICNALGIGLHPAGELAIDQAEELVILGVRLQELSDIEEVLSRSRFLY